MSDVSRHQWEERHRDDGDVGAPSPFVERALAVFGTQRRLATGPPRALDVACGRGRHALLLAEHGYRVDAVDFSLTAVRHLGRTATARGLAVHGIVTDVLAWPLPPRRYALVLVVSFLERALFPSLLEAVMPGGALLYETFVRDSSAADGPVRAEFVLEPGELEARCDGWRILLRDVVTTEHRGASARRAGILAERPFEPASRAPAH